MKWEDLSKTEQRDWNKFADTNQDQLIAWKVIKEEEKTNCSTCGIGHGYHKKSCVAKFI